MIAGYVGENGSGKTLCAVSDTIRRARRTGQKIVSTVPITAKGVTCVPVESWDQLLELENCHLLLDEIAIVASSRETAALRPDVIAFLGSLRHAGERGITLSWTAPAWARCDVTLREITQKVVELRGLIGGDDGLGWGSTVLSSRRDWKGTLRQGGEFPSRATGARIPLPKIIRLRSLIGWGTYDTHAKVRPLRDFGANCSDCGLPRRREFCRGH